MKTSPTEKWINAYRSEDLGEMSGVISDTTGFDNGAEFASEDEVRAYFTTAAMEEMFGDDHGASQAILDQMAKVVIENRWHCEF